MGVTPSPVGADFRRRWIAGCTAYAAGLPQP
jgi:hypothetical protein